VYFWREGEVIMMTNRKGLIIAVLGTFCLTLTLFMIVPTRSQSGIHDYDTWTDVNGDGTINMVDISISINKFMTSGDTTRNVNVTNWLPSEPKTVFYCESDVHWEDSGAGYSGPAPYLYVGDYTRMSILLKFNNIEVEYGDAYWTVKVEWTDTENGLETGWEILDSTLFHVYSSGGQGIQISTDSYTIKGPYVRLEPEMMGLGDEHKGNASKSIYLYLSYGTTTDSTLKTVNWYASRDTNDDFEGFGPYITQGFRQITIKIWTNVSCYVQVGGGLVDTFSKAYGWVMKTYQITGQSMGVFVSSPSSKPWYIQIEFYMTT
jgi:hypothetical protein